MPEQHNDDTRNIPLAGHDHQECGCGGNCRGCPNRGKHGHGHGHGHADED